MQQPDKRPSRAGLILPLLGFGLIVVGYVISLVIEFR